MEKDLGGKLVEHLKKRDLTQRELAQMIGVTEATMSRYINNTRTPNIEILANIATALQTTTDELLGNEVHEDNMMEFPKIKRIIARNAELMTNAQKRELIETLFSDEE